MSDESQPCPVCDGAMPGIEALRGDGKPEVRQHGGGWWSASCPVFFCQAISAIGNTPSEALVAWDAEVSRFKAGRATA